jgi:hypothetical protein
VSARDHERYREDVGAYLLGALPDLDRQAFERHLVGCQECREDVERLRTAADVLPRSVTPIEPPPSLKVSLMDSIRRQEPEPEPARRRQAKALPARLRLRPAIAWAGAAVLLAVGLLAGFGVGRVLDEDGVRTIAAQVDRSELPRTSASLSLPADGEEGAILRLKRVPSAGRGRVYQAWVQRDGEVVPQPTFEPGRDRAAAVALPGDLSNAKAVLVTREKRPGARAPSEAPILRVRL